jgi:carboxyl-terminal processing protease
MMMVKRAATRLAAAMAVVLFAGFAVPADTSYLFSVKKNIEVFGRVYKEIATHYVDQVDPDRFMEAGIEGMLESLDPYTVYIEQGEGDEVDLLTNGKYGGIGVTIGVRDGGVRVISVMDGYSAQRAGMIPGDRIIAVDGVSVEGKKPDEVRGLTRGEPGTSVKVGVQREGEQAALEFVLLREEIKLKNVTYADYIEPGIGYLRLERFSRLAGEEVRQALKDLKVRGELKGVILDVRGNPGGLLDAAVEVVSKFVPRGSLVVSTKGRSSDADKAYRSQEEPMLGTLPLVVLTDRASASASEIVAGGIQDLDRGLVVGTRTFGKGLVQTVLPLDYGSQLKMTTARYYTPSGRCIQEIDYLRRDSNGVFAKTPDSLKSVFTTSGGRKVYEHGGITPDSVVEEVDPGPMIRELQRKAMFFKFVTTYRAQHPSDTSGAVTPAMMREFDAFLKKEKFEFQEDTHARLEDVRKQASAYHYGDEVLKDLDLLTAALVKEKERAFERYAAHIENELEIELAGRLQGERGRIKASFPSDVQLNTAVAVLKNPKAYSRKLGI